MTAFEIAVDTAYDRLIRQGDATRAGNLIFAVRLLPPRAQVQMEDLAELNGVESTASALLGGLLEEKF